MAGQFREVDFDLLADYVGGALDGTPDEDEVARLVADDQSWAQAYAALAPAVDSVRDALVDWGTVPAPMPPEITERLVAALAAAQPAEQPVRQLSAVPGDGEGDAHGPARGTARSRRRWSRLAGPVTIAAAISAFAGFGVGQLFDRPESDSTDSAAVTGESAGRASQLPAVGGGDGSRALLEPAGAGLLTTGTEYTQSTLAGRIAALTGRPAGAESSGAGPGAAPEGDHILTAGGLQRLVDRGALAACLDAIAAAHGHGPLAVNVVDYASFDGAPALVIAFTDGSGARWAWASGPECGLAGSGADTRYETRVG